MSSMAAPSPLASLSPSVQNTRQRSTEQIGHYRSSSSQHSPTKPSRNLSSSRMSTYSYHDTSEADEFHDMSSNGPGTPSQSASERRSGSTSPSPVNDDTSTNKHTTDDDPKSTQSPVFQSTTSSNEPSGRTSDVLQTNETDVQDSEIHPGDEGMSTVIDDDIHVDKYEAADNTEMTLDMDDSINDTMNDVSTFSAIPDADLTRFAALRNAAATPTKGNTKGWSPSKPLRDSAAPTPGTVRRKLQLSTNGLQGDAGGDDDATPRRCLSPSPAEDLLNFTGQSHVHIPPPQSNPRHSMRRSPSGRGGFPIKINSSPNHRSQASVDRERSLGIISPVKHEADTPRGDRRANLLDFDLEPLATPRSIPSVTPRELESLRSDLSSQISSLSATLSGKEAEVLALKRAITATEIRSGHTSEELRNEKLLKEGLEQEKQDWERRGREMEAVLREIRQEIMIGEHERDKLRRQTEEAEKVTDEMEVRVVELRTRLDSANRRATLSPTDNPQKKAEGSGEPVTPLASGGSGAGLSGIDINDAVREATERVARELHGLYKQKHEDKVAALKKSYEARWEKKVRHLENELKSAKSEIADLRARSDSSSAADGGRSQQQQQHEQESAENHKRLTEALVKDKEHAEAERKILMARLEGMESEIRSVRQESSELRDQVEKERVEKGDLVAQVDLFLALGDSQPPPAPAPAPAAGAATTAPAPSSSSSSSKTGSVIADRRPGPASHKPNMPSSSSSSIPATHHPRPPHQRHSHSHNNTQSPIRPNPPTPTRRSGITAPGPHPTTGVGVGVGVGVGSSRPRPLSMLQAPGKFSGIPGPGGRSSVGVVAGAGAGVSRVPAAGAGGTRIMEGITRMGMGMGTGTGHTTGSR